MKNQLRRERARKLRRVVSVLEGALGRRRRRRRPDAMETILFAIMADGVADGRAEAVFEKIRELVVDWNELRVTSAREIEALLEGLPEAGVKAQAVRGFLGRLFLTEHVTTADFMKNWSGSRASKYLDEIESMTESMRARALLKGFEMDVLPASVDIVRVMKRVGVLDSHLSQERAHEFLKEVVAPKRTYAFFHLVNEHGLTCCHQRGPDCANCCISSDCEKFVSDKAKRTGGKKTAAEEVT